MEHQSKVNFTSKFKPVYRLLMNRSDIIVTYYLLIEKVGCISNPHCFQS